MSVGKFHTCTTSPVSSIADAKSLDELFIVGSRPHSYAAVDSFKFIESLNLVGSSYMYSHTSEAKAISTNCTLDQLFVGDFSRNEFVHDDNLN